MNPRYLLAVALAACGRSQPRLADPFAPAVIGKRIEGEEMLGRTAPALPGVKWTDGEARPLAEDRGRVVLLRWWTDNCPLCTNSAKAIRALKEKHGDDLVVRAIHHDKVRGRELQTAQVDELAAAAGFTWRNGMDPGWGALRGWWLDGNERAFTSVTFLLDREGRIALVHTGGEFHAEDQPGCLFDPADCGREFEAIDRAITELSR